MWTRYNIAESQVYLFIKQFEDDRKHIDSFLDSDLVSQNVIDAVNAKWANEDNEWKTFAERRQHMYNDVVDEWIAACNKWIDSCYDTPDRQLTSHSDRIVKTSDQICIHHDIGTHVFTGARKAKDMFEDFMEPILNEVKKHVSDSVYEEKHTLMKNVIYRTGVNKDNPHKYHSFFCLWVFVRTRVRYFELMPHWEMERIADDAEKFWQPLVDFRNELKNHPDRVWTYDSANDEYDLYSDATLANMLAKKNAIIDFEN